jgi:chemotaxis protein histidine kinase CheA
VSAVDDERAELVPVFVAEVRERLVRVAGLLPALDFDAQAAIELKRELHTLKGAGRMMALPEFAELCHAAEERLEDPGAGADAQLVAAHDALAALADAVERGDPLWRDETLLRSLTGGARSAAAPEPDPTPPKPVPAPAAPEGAPRHDLSQLDAFAERAVRVRSAGVATGRLHARLEELARLAEAGVRDPQPGQALAVLAASLRAAAISTGALETRLARAAEEQIEAVLALRLAPLRPLFHALARQARELARALGRELRVELEGEETRLDRRMAHELEAALRHLVTNAVDHGLEPPEERAAAGKPRLGRLRLQARPAGRGVEIVVADDGRGLDGARLVAGAVGAGLLSAAAASALGEAEALRLALLPGFSTRDRATEFSGRGVGLDAVDATVSRLGGSLRIDSAPGRGTSFVLDLPAARRGERVLVARLGGARIAVPAVVVRRVRALAGVRIEERDGERSALLGVETQRGEASGEVPGEVVRAVPFVELGAALGLAADAASLLVEASVGGRDVAFAVAGIEGEEEVLVRPLSRRLPLSPLVDGAALLPSGEPVAVLAPLALFPGNAGGDASGAPRVPGAALASRAATRILLVDDSPVTRELERRILADAGFRVELAGDGEEALERLAAEPFDCLVTDIEMPRLDGFALTERLRRTDRFARLPIVVVSTRERPEDKLRGLRAGADAYLAKQSLMAADLVETVRRLTGG